jgi:hypothetical protein
MKSPIPKKALGLAAVAVVVVGGGVVAISLKSTSSTNTVTASALSITPGPTGMIGGTTPTAGGELFTLVNLNGKANVQLLSASGKKSLATFPVSNNSTGIASNGSTTLALSQGTTTSGALTFYSATTFKKTGVAPLPGPSIGVAAGPNAQLFYALVQINNNDSLDVVNAGTGKTITSLPMPASTISFTVSPDGSSVYALQGTGNVSVVGINSGKVSQTFRTGPAARSIAISPDGSILYVLKGSVTNDNVAVVNVATQAVKYVLPAPAYTVQIQAAPNNTELYDVVGNPSYGNIQIFSTAK